MSYHYPLDESWSRQEIIDVVNFFNMIEMAYEGQVKRTDLLLAYERFKQIVPAKSEEKRFYADFQKSSGYSAYRVLKEAKNSTQDKIRCNR
ncbi:UPF0223 family protein [Aciduricibacillus chroicocephali]|uniref:UPF0223 protein QR721_05370 n=1 Tax=Aciduricibacillus chroicocephali TaxID=3054939 RepID=A0ABY9KY33_9BACI|nr:UPF0223 family protein [Bacillaceae bacterium 44XB]